VRLLVPLGDGNDQLLEVEVDGADLGESVQLAGRGGKGIRAPFTLASAVDRALPVLNLLSGGLRSIAHAPDEICVQLGLKIGGETGLIFTKGSGQATFTVTLTWRKPEAATGAGSCSANAAGEDDDPQSISEMTQPDQE